MKQVNFSHLGGFPLEQETLERIQTAYRYELFEALKSHLSIKPKNDYIVAPSTSEKPGWAIIHPTDNNGVKTLEGILYPILKGTTSQYLKTIRTGTNLVYGTGVSQTAYFDYKAQYISPEDYTNRPVSPEITDNLAVHYYDLTKFEFVKDIDAIEAIINDVKLKITAIEKNILAVEKSIDKIGTDITVINQTYLPLSGLKAMEGDLDLGSHKLSKLDTREAGVATVRAADFRLGSSDRKGKLNPGDSTGRALVDSSDDVSTSLSLNYKSDWKNTNIGGKVYLDNLNTSTSTGSLLVIDNSNQVTKSNTLIESLISRITELENKTATAVPIGMIAIWGKSKPFPKGWEEYVPLRGRMPVGLKANDPTFDTILKNGGDKNKTLAIAELPPHYHHKPDSVFKSFAAGSGDYGESSSTGTSTDGGDNSQMAIGRLGQNYNANGDALERTVGDGQPFSILNPYRVVQFIEYTGLEVDEIKPSPTVLRSVGVGRTYVALEWLPASDNRGVTNYLIYKDDVLFAIVDDVLFFTVNGLSRSSSYNFHVVARDAAGNLSNPSNVVREKTNLL